jgi:fibronectin-binding autotransporter adhesin
MIFRLATVRSTPVRRAARMVIVIAIACFPASVFAQAFSWGLTGTGGPGTWDSGTTANWWNGTSNVVWPVTGTSARFGGTAGSVTISGSVTATDLTFVTTGYTLTGGTLGLTGTSSIVVGTGTTATVASVIGGASGLTKNGGGLLILTATNAYTGTTTISAGTVNVGNGGTTGLLGTGPISIGSGALLSYNYSTRQSLSVPTNISGNGSLAVTMAGTASNQGGMFLTGNVTVGGSQSYTSTGGSFFYKGLAANAANVTLTGSAITINADVGNATGANGNNLILDTSGSNGPINLNISIGRSGVLYQLNNFTANSGTGALVISGGRAAAAWSPVQATSLTGALAISDSFTMTGTGATLRATAASTISGNLGLPTANTFTVDPGVTMTVSGTLSGATAAITKTGSGTLALNAANTFAGTTLVSAGTLSLGNNLALQSSPLDTSGAGRIALAGGVTTPTIGGLRGGNDLATVVSSGYGSMTGLNLNPAAGTSGTYSGVIADGAVGTTLTVVGSGTQVLSGANTFTGPTRPMAGTLVVSNSLALQNSALTMEVTGSGAVAFSQNSTLAGLGGARNIDASGVTLTVGNGSTLAGYGGSLSNGSLTKIGSGTQTLTGANAYTGATTVTAGALVVASSGSLSPSTIATVSGGALVVAADASSGARTFGNAIVLTGGTLRGGIADNIGTGGTAITADGNGVTHYFTSTGSTGLVLPTSVTGAKALVVGAGGGGGGGSAGVAWSAGGGGGRVLNLTGLSLSAGTTSVVVGVGGTGAGNGNGTAGGASILATSTAVGGSPGLTSSPGVGGASGSGQAGGANGGAVSSGGGGGDSAPGTAGNGGSSLLPGRGGAGSQNTAITGFVGPAANFFGGGGGGGSGSTGGAGGAGGGGTASAGTANTGGGGGAFNNNSYNGGSGIVVVQYAYNSSAAAASLTLSGSIDLQSASTLDASTTGGLVNVTGTIGTSTGTGGLTIASSLASGGIVQFSSPMTYLGDTTVASGAILRTNATNALPNGSGKGNLLLSGTLDLNGVGTTTVNGLSGSGVVNNLLASATGSYTLVAGANDVTGTFAGSIRNAFGSVGLTKVGTGLLALTGSSSNTGPTTVSGGTLAVNGVLGSGSVSVAATAWLQGTGTVAGPVNVLGTLSPGNSPGVLTLGSVSLGATSNTVIEITGTSRGTQYDGVTITSTSSPLTYGGTLSLSFGSLFANNTTFDIFNFTGLFSGSYSSVVSTGSYAGSWSPLGSGTYQLISGAQTLTFYPSTGDIIIVPEPAAIAMAGVGIALAGRWLTRRRTAA